MIKATFYCNIVNENEDIIESEFDFDNYQCNTREELDKYILDNGYQVGETCCYWGNNKGVLTEIFIDDTETD